MPPSKNEIISLLDIKAFDVISNFSCNDRKVISKLISLSYEKKSQVSWRAIEAIGLAAKEISKSHPDVVRNIANRLLWMMRDESGGIPWSAPQILGEIVRNNPGLCSDLAPIIASSHDEIMLRSGVIWAMGRIGKINTETVEYAVPIIRSYIYSSDKTLCGYAVWALGEMGATEVIDDLEALRDDNSSIDFYEEGELKQKTVGKLAAEVLKKLKGPFSI
ncbi:MAG: HEAT repeat domain-containing protein [Nitrospirae bacterium]|nr:HEAT repeat domain-containing protein [Nitrospirota bacterium]